MKDSGKTKTRGILFSPVMAEALRAGRKTETRRLGEPQHSVGDRLYVRENYYQAGFWEECGTTPTGRTKMRFSALKDPFFELGDRIALNVPAKNHPQLLHNYRRLGRFMPRIYSRLWLEVVHSASERLQDIDETSARAEGAMFHDGRGVGHSGWRHDYADVYGTARESFAALWDRIHAKAGEAWRDNPLVSVTRFTVHHGNIDEV